MSRSEDSRVTRSAPSRRPLSIILYIMSALALIAVLFQATQSDTTATIAGNSASTTSQPPATVPLAALVPGLTGTFRAIEGSEQLDLISWDAEGSMTIDADLPRGRPDRIALDAAGESLGVSILDTSSGAGRILAGDPADLHDVGLDAKSFVWHQTTPGAMAAVSSDFGSSGSLLMKLAITSGTVTAADPVTALGPQGVVLAWGSWGFVIAQHESDINRIVLLDSSGSPVWSRHAHWAYASPTGDLLLSFNNNEIREFHRVEIDSNAADTGAWFELPSLGVTGVSWSPDSDRVAVVSFAGGAAYSRLDIYDNEGNLLHQLPMEWRVWDVEWSEDGRFLVMPGVQQGTHAVLFYDVGDDRLTPVTFDDPIRAALLAG